MNIRNILLVIALSLVFTIPGSTQNTLSTILKNGEIRIGMTGNQPPYSMKTKNDRLMGYEVDLAAILAESMGVKLKIVEMPFPELMQALESSKVDAVMSGMTITPRRSLRALFAGPYTISGKSILTKSKVLSEISEASEANVRSYKITCLKGSTSEKFVRSYMPNSEIIPVENYDLGIDMVLHDQADALVADLAICIVTLLKHQDEGLVMLDEPLSLEPIGIALPTDDLQFFNLIDNYMTGLELTGALDMLDQIWFEDGTWLLNMK